MTVQNLKLGLGISLGIAIIGIFQKLLRMEQYEYSAVLVSCVYGFIFCILNWIAHDFLLNNKFYQRLMGNRIASGMVSVAAVASTILLYDLILPDFSTVTIQFQDLSPDKKSALLLVRGFLISGLSYFIIYHLDLLLQKQQDSIEIEYLKQAQLEATLSSLKEQLSPHFLFNTLNTLSSLTSEDSVKEYIAELADVYRYVLQYKEMDTATLEQELKFIESYFYILKARLEDAIEISIDVDKNILQSKIPPLTLQLLIENAVKHNIASSPKKLFISIDNQDGSFLRVQNNYQPKSSIQISAGVGITNIIQRYNLLFRKEVLIEKNNSTFTVKLPII